MSAAPVLLAGFAVTNRAVCAQLTERGHPVVACDDAPDGQARQAAAEMGVELIERPDLGRWSALAAGAAAVVPTPGLPESHPALGAAAKAGVPVISELDMAQRWDSRPTLAVTGTNGKTTVTLLAAAMLEASGVAVTVAGNTDTPLVEAIRDPRPEAFVVEASSFRLGYSRCYRPAVGAWLNFGPDHLDVHASLDTYLRAKAAVWRGADEHTIAVVNRDDPMVAAHAPAQGRVVTFGLEDGDFHLSDGALWAEAVKLGPEKLDPDDLAPQKLADVSELRRSQPHELSNYLAAAAVAMAGGAHPEGVRDALGAWDGLPHRMALVATRGGVRFVDDSKATTPHAVVAAVRAAAPAVLIAGGRNKGLELAPLAEAAGGLRSVVAIGEAAAEIHRALSGHCPVTAAANMAEAVATAAEMAQPGDTVLLSPGCASFDWYSSYAERGEDFSRLVHELTGLTGGSQ